MTPATDLEPLAGRALAASGMDSVGLYLLDEADRPRDGVILGMPLAFVRAYEVAGMPIDHVLAEMRRTGRPSSTETCRGPRWTASALYQRVSGRFGLRGFAAFPLYDEEALTGVLYLGASSEAARGRLGPEGLLEMSVLATRAAAGLARLPPRLPPLTARQREVAEAAAQGLSNREIASALGTGEAAVRKHLKALNRLLGTSNRTAMAARLRGA